MTSRARVLNSINHREPDRLPVFKPNIIRTYEPFGKETQNYLDNYDFDCLVGLKSSIGLEPKPREDIGDGVTEDEFGCRFKYMGVGMPYCIQHPLAHAQSIGEIERFPWPDVVKNEIDETEAAEHAIDSRKNIPFATSISVGSIFHQYHYLRGFEQWLMDMKINPELHEAVARKIYSIRLEQVLQQLDVVGEYTDIVVAGDDFGHSTATYFSPEDFRSLIKPYYEELITAIKKKCPHIKFYFHSHGRIMDIVPDLIDCGVDIEKILVFGSVDDVKRHVSEVLEILAPGGGYLFKAQAISHLIPFENLITAYDLAREYDGYAGV